MPRSKPTPRPRALTRRTFLKAGAAIGAAGAVGSTIDPSQARLIDTALAGTPTGPASLSDVEHVVILMQENRSFDHYFGTLSGVRGFADPTAPAGVFTQRGWRPGAGPDPTGSLQPFELVSNPPAANGQATYDISHEWVTQHLSWNSGAMDGFVGAHTAVDTNALDGSNDGFLTMGYYARRDLAFYHALADAFTICDGYFCSVLGPTDPNRLMWMSASIGTDGSRGGPVLQTYVAPTSTSTLNAPTRVQELGTLSWETMPERLTEAGVSWKVYQDPSSAALFNVLLYFKQFALPSSLTQVENAANGLVPVYPAQFAADVALGCLPKVSWIIPPVPLCEHPGTPPGYGEFLVQQILQTLVSNPAVWARTVFIVTWDENGGWFDHVPPPAPGPTVTSVGAVPTDAQFAGEYVTTPIVPATPADRGMSVFGPVGLGFRVPCLVISPFSRGGYVCGDTLDHTSTLRLIETRFGVPVPNLSPWRRGVTGDMTGALPRLTSPDTDVPALPPTSVGDLGVAEQAVVNSLTGVAGYGLPYPPPTHNGGVPAQEASPARTRIG